MKQQQIHVLDLTRVEGNGEFACPRCGAIISPDDETDKAYSIIDVKVKNGILVEVEIQCRKCASHISLTGFNLLQKVEGKRKKPPRKQKRQLASDRKGQFRTF